MKLRLLKGFGLCIMSKCLTSDKLNKVLTDKENHSKVNENHSKENEGVIPKESSSYSDNVGVRDNTQSNCLYSPWVYAVDIVCDGPASNSRWGIPKGIGLRGGGENSLNTGTSGWGTPTASGGSGWGGNPPGPPQGQWGANRPPGQSNPNATQQQGTDFNQNKSQTSGQQPGPSQNQNNAQQAQQQGGSNSQQPSSSQGQNPPGNNPPNTSWAQAAGKGLPNSNHNQNTAQSSATKQLEQLNIMREALFSQDGWGGQHVNQETNWETPGSPEQGIKNDSQAAGGSASGVATQMWKPNVNNGTDLWEANLRNGGQPPLQPQNKTPWNHTPSTNLGGTWGEEDEPSDTSNVWTGVPPNNTNNSWPGSSNSTNWPSAPEKKAEWTGGASNAAGAAWGDPRGVAIDPREMNRDIMHGGVMRGDPRGVSGRLSNTSDMWAMQQQHQPQQPQNQQQAPNKMGPNLPPGGGNQWSGNLPKDLSNMPGNPPKPTGWEEPSPPAQRRNIPNYDDGTSLWGQQHARTGMQPPGTAAPNKNLSHWKDLPAGSMGRGNMPCPPGMPQNRMPGAATNIKPDNPVWGHPARNGAWDGHDGGPPVGGGWGDEGKGPTGNWVGEQPLTSPSWPAGPKPAKAPGWTEDLVDSSWVHPSIQRQQMPKQFSKDIILASKPFKLLTDMNFKKEDVENALRTTNMSLQDAFEILTSRMPETWNRRQDEHSFDQSAASFSRGFNPGQQMSFPQGGPGNVANNPATAGLLNNLTNNPGLAPINNMKVLSQQMSAAQQPNNQLNQAQRPGTNQPSQQQLKMLVQQIQMAVQAGYLNHQILNQSLAPQTLILLNQLLQQIKILQQLNQQHNLMSLGGQLKNNGAAALQLSVQITKVKQSISNFQNQITAQQAAYVKQQAHLMPHNDPPVDLFKSNLTDPLNTIQTNFSDLSLNKDTSQTSFQTQQSRLNQWKLPSLDKDVEGNEFSRAPGTTSKSSLPQGHSSPNINPLLGQTDATWSSVSRSNSDTGWPDSATNDITPDAKDTQWNSQPPANAFADIIPEFEPGKPWKGTQIKSVEDDPSMTPGSVARSPLSLATIKDTEILSSSSKSSPPVTSAVDTVPPLSLSSSPWTFNPNSSSVYTSPLSKLTNSKPWGETPPTGPGTSELWLAPSKARGPPPGLSAKVSQNNWGSATGPRSSWSSSSSGWNTSWLLLRNLTPQIDGSTLKTLCRQHGPLQNFHLYLNHGIAFAKYSSREEASKAQTALNNCVLGNTTIFAESPGESDVATMLSSLGHSQPQTGPQAGSQNWNLRGQAPPSKQPSVSDTWAASGGGSNLWQPNLSGSTLWGSEGDSHRTTPSASLNSYLPPDLLNGESM